MTDDGSHTLYVPEIDECYHSTHGAIQEAGYIFIQAGFSQISKKTVSILEIGFGTGLNAYLTLLKSSETLRPINYTGVELYPVPAEMALLLNYPEEAGGGREIFEKLHEAPWGKKIKITDLFCLTKIHSDFTHISFDKKFDVIYFDAFSPEKQPEMWSEEMFEKLYLCTAENGIITTYCSKGTVRRAMKSAGFYVEKLPARPEKEKL